MNIAKTEKDKVYNILFKAAGCYPRSQLIWSDIPPQLVDDDDNEPMEAWEIEANLEPEWPTEQD